MVPLSWVDGILSIAAMLLKGNFDTVPRLSVGLQMEDGSKMTHAIARFYLQPNLEHKTFYEKHYIRQDKLQLQLVARHEYWENPVVLIRKIVICIQLILPNGQSSLKSLGNTAICRIRTKLSSIYEICRLLKILQKQR